MCGSSTRLSDRICSPILDSDALYSVEQPRSDNSERRSDSQVAVQGSEELVDGMYGPSVGIKDDVHTPGLDTVAQYGDHSMSDDAERRGDAGLRHSSPALGVPRRAVSDLDRNEAVSGLEHGVAHLSPCNDEWLSDDIQEYCAGPLARPDTGSPAHNTSSDPSQYHSVTSGDSLDEMEEQYFSISEGNHKSLGSGVTFTSSPDDENK